MNIREEIDNIKSEVAWQGTERRLSEALKGRKLPPVVQERIETEAESTARKRKKALTEEDISKIIQREITYADRSAESAPPRTISELPEKERKAALEKFHDILGH